MLLAKTKNELKSYWRWSINGMDTIELRSNSLLPSSHALNSEGTVMNYEHAVCVNNCSCIHLCSVAVLRDEEETLILENALVVAQADKIVDAVYVLDRDLDQPLSGLYVRPDERAIYIRRPYNGYLSASFFSSQEESRYWQLALNYSRIAIEFVGMEIQSEYVKIKSCSRYLPGAWVRCNSHFQLQKQPIKLATEVLDGALHDQPDKIDFALVPQRDARQVHYKTVSSFSGRKLWLSRKNGDGKMANFTWAISENLSFIASGDCEDLARLESKIWSVQDLGTQRWNMNERSQKVFTAFMKFH